MSTEVTVAESSTARESTCGPAPTGELVAEHPGGRHIDHVLVAGHDVEADAAPVHREDQPPAGSDPRDDRLEQPAQESGLLEDRGEGRPRCG
jgi:hypothetical protein